jgi:STE24 endopeptidase
MAQTRLAALSLRTGWLDLLRGPGGPSAAPFALRLVVVATLALTPVSSWGQASLAPDPVSSTTASQAAARDPYTVQVTPEMRRHQAWDDSLYFGGAALGWLVLLGVLGLGVSRRVRDLAARVTVRPFWLGVGTFGLLSVVLFMVMLPFEALEGYVIPHRFGLSAQGYWGWLGDHLKGLLVEVAIGAPVAALALAAIHRFRRWWLALWLGAVPLVALLMVVAPVVLDPVFNDFRPLKDASLRLELEELAGQAGIVGGRLVEVDRSKQTRTMNAWVNGLGPTTRIVLWDTIIAGLDRAELRFVMAHEMGHYVRGHIWIGLAAVLGTLGAAFWAGQRAVDAATRRWGQQWGFGVPSDPAALPLLLLVLGVLVFLATPALNAVSRYLEHEADTFAIELTRNGDAGARAFVKLAEGSKKLPDPHPLIRFLRYAHPTIAERITFCRSYRPWEGGQPNRVFKPAR